MIVNYIKSTHRYFTRNKIQSLIQVFSLAIGLTVFILVTLYLYDELTLDRSNPNFSLVYRIEMLSSNMDGSNILPPAPIRWILCGLNSVILNQIPVSN